MDQHDLEKILKASSKSVKPRKVFALKMRWRLFKVSFGHVFHVQKVTFKYGLASVTVFFMFTSGVGAYAYTSPDVNVTHPLYPIKEGVEDLEVAFSFNPRDRAKVHLKCAFQRAAEAEGLRSFLDQEMPEDKREALEKTLELMERNLDESILSAAVEQDIEMAEKVVDGFERDFPMLKKKMDKMDGYKRAMQSSEFIEGRYKNLDLVKEDIIKAKQLKRPRVDLRNLRDQMMERHESLLLDHPNHMRPVPQRS